jgi:hypothetical protein
MHWVGRASYRVRQFARRLIAWLRPPDLAPVADVLPDQARALFAAMPPGDQQHGLCVLACLREQSAVPAELAQAALLHDVGKAGGGLSLPYRTAIVLLGAVRPVWLARISSSPRRRLMRPFYVHRHHAQIGAALCQEAGCPGETVQLVRLHEETPPVSLDHRTHEMLAALIAADDRC